jgi:hypothetical protein
VNTFFALMAEFNTGQVPLSEVCEKYFGLDYRTACKKALIQQLPVPAYRGGSQKSPWLVSAQDLAKWIDDCREQARKDHGRMAG